MAIDLNRLNTTINELTQRISVISNGSDLVTKKMDFETLKRETQATIDAANYSNLTAPYTNKQDRNRFDNLINKANQNIIDIEREISRLAVEIESSKNKVAAQPINEEDDELESDNISVLSDGSSQESSLEELFEQKRAQVRGNSWSENTFSETSEDENSKRIENAKTRFEQELSDINKNKVTSKFQAAAEKYVEIIEAHCKTHPDFYENGVTLINAATDLVEDPATHATFLKTAMEHKPVLGSEWWANAQIFVGNVLNVFRKDAGQKLIEDGTKILDSIVPVKLAAEAEAMTKPEVSWMSQVNEMRTKLYTNLSSALPTMTMPSMPSMPSMPNFRNKVHPEMKEGLNTFEKSMTSTFAQAEVEMDVIPMPAAEKKSVLEGLASFSKSLTHWVTSAKSSAASTGDLLNLSAPIEPRSSPILHDFSSEAMADMERERRLVATQINYLKAELDRLVAKQEAQIGKKVEPIFFEAQKKILDKPVTQELVAPEPVELIADLDKWAAEMVVNKWKEKVKKPEEVLHHAATKIAENWRSRAAALKSEKSEESTVSSTVASEITPVKSKSESSLESLTIVEIQKGLKAENKKVKSEEPNDKNTPRNG